MRRAGVVAHSGFPIYAPRGWMLLGAILASWMLVAFMWTGTSQLFAFVAAAV